MADLDLVQKINETPSLIAQLGKAFLELEAYEYGAEEKVQWKEIEEYLRLLETSLFNKYLELEVRDKVYKEQERDASLVLVEKEATVAAKEQDMLDRIQELKNAAVASISETWASHQPISLEPIDAGDNDDGQVSSPLGDTHSQHTAPDEKSPHDMGENVEDVPGEVKPHPELTQICEQMDAKGLLNFTMENLKNKPSIIEELSFALESAVEPGRLVLASLEGIYPLNESTKERDKNDAAFRGMRQSCLMFLEAMATMLARADSGADHLLNPEIQQLAKVIADEWKPKLADASIDAANGNSLEAEAFLQLLATFRIASEFNEEELCKLVLAVAHNRQAPELCHSLGLTHKIPGIIEALIDGGKQIDAVHFVHVFQLTEIFPPVPLLKTYLKDLRRNSQGKGGSIGGVAGVQKDGNAQELAALRVVIQCVRDYGLEAEYPLDPLQRRVAQLEKLKPDKKRVGESGRHQHHKKPRQNGGYRAVYASAAVTGRHAPPAFGDRTPFAGKSETYPPAVPNSYGYQALSQPTHAHQAPSQSLYAHPAPSQSSYGHQVANPSAYTPQAYDQRAYYHAQDDRVNATTYNALPSTYGSYMGTGMQSSHQPYM